MVHIQAAVLIDHVRDIFCAAGVPDTRAAIVAASLVESDLVGHDSHGVLRVGSYIEAIERGAIDPRAEIEIVRSSASTAVIDGHRGLGMIHDFHFIITVLNACFEWLCNVDRLGNSGVTPPLSLHRDPPGSRSCCLTLPDTAT